MARNTLMIMIGLTMALNFSCTKAGKGAAIGGVGGGALGAGIGAAVGGKKGAAIGAGVGAAVGATTGAVVGHYMDKKEKKLREELKSASIERVGDELVVKFASGILFDVNKDSLKGAAKTGLTDFASVLKEYPKTDLSIEGHTDSDGSSGYNMKLSEARAQQVRAYLATQGVASDRMVSKGFGEDKPVADNDSAAGKQQNRRVEVKIVPNEELLKEDAEAQAKDEG